MSAGFRVSFTRPWLIKSRTFQVRVRFDTFRPVAASFMVCGVFKAPRIADLSGFG
jgi:hypothetical protein